MSYLRTSLKTRGILRTARRTGQIISRYGFTKGKMTNSVVNLIDLLEKYDAKATLPVTANLLTLHEDFIPVFKNKRIELAVHGLVHIDHTKLTYNQLLIQLNRSRKIFAERGFVPSGFRAPYLMVNNTVLKAVHDTGFLYDSSFVHIQDLDHEARHFQQVSRLTRFYGNLASSPRVWKHFDILEIPVMLPDDEILKDRLLLEPGRVGQVWIQMLERMLKNQQGEVFVLQLHLERFQLLKEAVDSLFRYAVNKGVEIKALNEITSSIGSGSETRLCFTGDIDILQLSDIFGHGEQV
jgi:hypothetical protein